MPKFHSKICNLRTYFLVQLLLLLGFSILAAEPQISFKNLDATQAHVYFFEADSDLEERTQKKIFVLRIKDQASIKALADKEYLPSPFFGTEMEDSYTGDGNLVVYSGAEQEGEFFLLELAPNTEYLLDAYYFVNDSQTIQTEVFSTGFFTLTEKPKVQAYNVLYKNTTSNSLKFTWKRGDGAGCMVIMRPGAMPANPLGGRVYQADVEYGKGDMLGEETFVVYKGIENSVEVKNLSSNTKYFIKIVEYNGEGRSINYMLEETGANPSKKMTMLETPVFLEPIEIGSDYFMPAWKPVPGAETYILDVARDDDFEDIIKEWQGVDVGNLTEFYVDMLKPDEDYYIRVRAESRGNRSELSKVMNVETKDEVN